MGTGTLFHRAVAHSQSVKRGRSAQRWDVVGPKSDIHLGLQAHRILPNILDLCVYLGALKKHPTRKDRPYAAKRTGCDI